MGAFSLGEEAFLAAARLVPRYRGPMVTHRTLNDASGSGPSVGDLAPGFTLRQTFERDVSLDELLEGSSVLLCFYVFDFGHV